MATKHPLRPAAGVIPLRISPEGEKLVLLVQRAGAGSFFPGFHAFPGGSLEKEDSHVPGLDPALAGALRELVEEVGLWPGPQPTSEERRRLLEGTLPLQELLLRYPPDLGALRPAGVRNTPAYSPIRFSAQFYLWETEQAGPVEVAPGELESAEWWTVTEALQAWRDNRISLAAPTQSALLALQRAETAAEAAADLESQGRETPDPIPVCPGWAYVPLPTATLPPAEHTLCFVVGDPGDCLLVDPGCSDEGELARLERVLGGRPPRAVIFTHHHPDHVGGYAWARRQGAPIWAHALTSTRLPGPADRLLEDGERLSLQAMEVTVLFTPGHAPGHIALWEERRRILMAADLVSSISTIRICPPEGNLAQYLQSLERCRELQPRLVLPSHGGPFGPGSDLLGRTLRHRLAREDKVVKALQPQPQSLDELLPQAYDDTSPSLWPLASASLLAHLLKLEKEGLARQTEGLWVLG